MLPLPSSELIPSGVPDALLDPELLDFFLRNFIVVVASAQATLSILISPSRYAPSRRWSDA
jgi:hypothetical protein